MRRSATRSTLPLWPDAVQAVAVDLKRANEPPVADAATPATPATPATETPLVRSCLDCVNYVPPRCNRITNRILNPQHGFVDDPASPPCGGVDWLLRPQGRRGYGRPFPMKCSWDQWGDRLVTKCDDPEPTEDCTGCAHCGAVKFAEQEGAR